MHNQQTMNNPQALSRPLYGTVPAQFAQLNAGGDMFGDEFEWDETETEYNGEALADNVLAFLREAAAE